jgi:hypothetical protein
MNLLENDHDNETAFHIGNRVTLDVVFPGLCCPESPQPKHANRQR